MEHRVLELFGGPNQENILLEAYLNGATAVGRRSCAALLGAGLLRYVSRFDRRVCLDIRHPAYSELRSLLFALTRKKGAAPVRSTERSRHRVEPYRLLGRRGINAARILLTLSRFGPASQSTIVERNRSSYPDAIKETIAVLVADGLVERRSRKFEIASNVPPQFLRFVEKTWRSQESSSHHFSNPTDKLEQRTWAFRKGSDGAPLLFGTDLRLRNLMALAKHGPIRSLELRRLSGAPMARSERRDDAPLGRGGLAKQYGTGRDRVWMLDPAYPLHKELRRLLLKIEHSYALPRYVQEKRTQKPLVPTATWSGDRRRLFGATVATAILTSIGVTGWTYEALCVVMATGHDRVVVKKTMKRLEEEGILCADRPRKPGFNIRVVKLNPEFCAYEELLELVRAYVDVWPHIKGRYYSYMRHLPQRTREHLRRRGLLPID